MFACMHDTKHVIGKKIYIYNLFLMMQIIHTHTVAHAYNKLKKMLFMIYFY